MEKSSAMLNLLWCKRLPTKPPGTLGKCFVAFESLWDIRHLILNITVVGRVTFYKTVHLLYLQRVFLKIRLVVIKIKDGIAFALKTSRDYVLKLTRPDKITKPLK
jgi:hypothetical protein